MTTDGMGGLERLPLGCEFDVTEASSANAFSLSGWTPAGEASLGEGRCCSEGAPACPRCFNLSGWIPAGDAAVGVAGVLGAKSTIPEAARLV